MFEIKRKPKPKLTEADTGKILYSFVTPECIDHERGQTWFLVLGFFVVVGVVFGLMQDSLSFVILSVLLGGVYTTTHSKKSPEITVSFTEHGMVWKDSFFLYSSIHSFWIFWKPNETKVLHVNKTEGFPKELVIPIHTADPAKIKEVLGYYVPEIEGKKEKFSDVMARTLKL